MTASPSITIHRPATVTLSSFGFRRLAPPSVTSVERPLGTFDHATLFFDVFEGSRPDEIICVGPPLDALEPAGFSLRFAAATARGPIAVRTERSRIRQQPNTRTVLRAPGLGRASHLEISAAGRRVEVPVTRAAAAGLAGRRVLLALQRDNPLHWIGDWARFHVAQQGIDAVLLYDNGSTAYGPEAIAETLAAVPGLRDIVVVDWPFPFGVGGPPTRPAGDNYCQTGAFDHARRCFCAAAASVLNLDIDELLPAAGQPLDAGSRAAVHFHGIWAEAPGIVEEAAARRLRHCDCRHVWVEQLHAVAAGNRTTLCRSKWLAVPARCSTGVEWGVHEVYPATRLARLLQRFWRTTSREALYRHFRQINTGWKTERWRSSADFDTRCHPDAVLAAAFDALERGAR